jgi:hypothetical protein
MLPFLFFTFLVRYDDIYPKQPKNQLSWSEQWSKFASTVDTGFEDANDWIKNTVKTRLITITFWQDGAYY